jgi:hypothetical protein
MASSSHHASSSSITLWIDPKRKPSYLLALTTSLSSVQAKAYATRWSNSPPSQLDFGLDSTKNVANKNKNKIKVGEWTKIKPLMWNYKQQRELKSQIEARRRAHRRMNEAADGTKNADGTKHAEEAD